jgi:uncharacterized protein YjbJ (UPF0337 family)
MSTTTLNEPWLKGKWNEIKGKIQEEWGELTNDDVDRAEGNRDQFIGAIQQRYGIAKAKAEKQVEEWEERHGLR